MSGDGRGPALRAEGLRKSYAPSFILDVPEFEIEGGSTYAVLGSSGSGKSTLLRLLGLLERPDEGRVILGGVEIRPRDYKTRRTMAGVFQQPFLFNGTVGQNVAFGLKLRKVDVRERSQRVRDALERVGLSGSEDAAALRLSGGESQRVALARALVLEPRVLLLDEPLSSLDPVIKTRLTEDFANILRHEGVTTLYVTHDQDEAMVVADHVGIMHKGRFVSAGRMDDVMVLPTDAWVAGFIGMEPPLHGHVVRNAQGVLEIECGKVTVRGVSILSPGQEVRVAVRPEDVTLFAAGGLLPPSSARNRIETSVVEISPRGATVRVVVEEDMFRVAAAVSRAAVAELGLKVGSRVLAVFKATATRVAPVVPGDDGAERAV